MPAGIPCVYAGHASSWVVHGGGDVAPDATVVLVIAMTPPETNAIPAAETAATRLNLALLIVAPLEARLSTMCTRRDEPATCLVRVPAGPSQGVIVQAIEKETDWYDDVLDARNALRARIRTGLRRERGRGFSVHGAGPKRAVATSWSWLSTS